MMPMSRNKPRGRAFGSGPDNPSKLRSFHPKNDVNSLASLLDENCEIKGVSEKGDQPNPFERGNQENRVAERESYLPLHEQR
jgi:hypothetical protein